MMKTRVILMSMLLLMLSGCSNDDEYAFDPAYYPVYGYWEFSGADYSGRTEMACGAIEEPTIFIGRQGLLIKPNGVINSWDIIMEQYSESLWGKLTLDNDGKLAIQIYSDESVEDAMYYKIKEVTPGQLVIRIYGGITGIPYEKGYDYKYRKLKSKPTRQES